MDEEFHASGLVSSKLTEANVIIFPHNDFKYAEKLLQSESYKNAFIAIEGVYSMGGDLAKKEFFEIADRSDAILIVDEAHSSGVLGKNLLAHSKGEIIVSKSFYDSVDGALGTVQYVEVEEGIVEAYILG